MESSEQNTVSLTFPAQNTYIQASLEFANTLAANSGFDKKVQTKIRLAREKFDVIYLYLNLEKPGASYVVDECVKEGFIIAGVSPDTFPEKDALVISI